MAIQLDIVMTPPTFDVAQIAKAIKIVGEFDAGSALASFTFQAGVDGYNGVLTTSNSRVFNWEDNDNFTFEDFSSTGIFTQAEMKILYRLMNEMSRLLDAGLTKLTFVYTYV